MDGFTIHFVSGLRTRAAINGNEWLSFQIGSKWLPYGQSEIRLKTSSDKWQMSTQTALDKLGSSSCEVFWGSSWLSYVSLYFLGFCPNWRIYTWACSRLEQCGTLVVSSLLLYFPVHNVTITSLCGHFNRAPITKTSFLALSFPVCVCICPRAPWTLGV